MPLQVVTIVAVCGLLAWVGFFWVAATVLVVTIFLEYCIYRLFRRQVPFSSLTKDQIIWIALTICGINTVLYCIPGIFIAQHPSVALKISSVLWALGIQVFVTNTWSRVASFLYATLVPSIVMLGTTIFSAASTAPVSGTPLEWAIAFGFVVCFVYATIDTLRGHLRTQDALIDAETDASQRLTQLEEAQRLDGLTGLLNRPAFDRALGVMLADRNLEGGEIAVFLIDLDSFKPINDTFTHEAGDQVLHQTAERLRSFVGDRGIVGRMGGDEFICAVTDLDNCNAAMTLGRDLAKRIVKPVVWRDRNLKIGASIGLAMTGNSADAPAATVTALCSAADQAMFAAKPATMDGPVLYNAQLFAPRMTASETQVLIDSIADHSIRLHYQPKVSMTSGKLEGFEALARWHHPDGKLRRPSAFVDQIAELGLQGEFMFSMARQVVGDIRTMLEAGIDPGHVSLNIAEVALATLTGRQEIQTILDAHPQVRDHLTFEITEDVFIARSAGVIQTSIKGFRDQGLRISLDDFGTGFASFYHLQQLEFDELKIDSGFVRELGENGTAEVLVKGFLEIASGLGMHVVAEGVETPDQVRFLANLGCTVAQGNLYHDALPLEKAIALLKAEKAA